MARKPWHTFGAEFWRKLVDQQGFSLLLRNCGLRRPGVHGFGARASAPMRQSVKERALDAGPYRFLQLPPEDEPAQFLHQ
jgi:hypothetical protein